MDGHRVADLQLAPLTGELLLSAWEHGAAVSPLRRGPAVLAAMAPGLPADDLSLGSCDTLLLELRVGSFGTGLSAVADCPACGESVDVEADASAMLAQLPPASVVPPAPQELVHGSYRVCFRLPTTRDLVAALAALDPRQALAERCVLSAANGDGPVPVTEVPADVMASVNDLMDDADPAADLQFRLACAGCGEGWSERFDIATLLWSEIVAAGTGLLLEIDELARRYGWSEQAILAMSPTRRRAYLDLP
jgi:hypothetical protein